MWTVTKVALASAFLAAAFVATAWTLSRPEPTREWDRVRYGKEWRPEVEAPNYEPRDDAPATYRM